MKCLFFEKIIKIGTLSKINQKKEKRQINNTGDEK